MAPNRLCLITAQAPVPAFLGGSCPLGCSLNAPATGGCSVFSLQCSLYAAGSGKEKWAGCPLHGAIIAHLFVFCKGGMAGPPDSGVRPLMGTGVLSWLAPAISGGSGLACAVVLPAHPPTFLETGGLAVPRAGAAPPAPCLGEGGSVVACALLQWGGLAWRAPLSHLAHPPTFLETGGLAVPPAGGCRPLHPAWWNGGGSVFSLGASGPAS